MSVLRLFSTTKVSRNPSLTLTSHVPLYPRDAFLSASLIKVKGVLVNFLLLLLPRLHPLLDCIQLLHNRRIPRRKFGRLVQVCESIILVLLARFRLRPPEVAFRLVLVRDALDIQRLGRILRGFDVLARLVLEQRAIRVEGDF
jgi:hypothetical protein